VYNRYVRKVTSNKNQTSSEVEKTVRQPQHKKGLSLEYVLRPKNQEFDNFSINWDCEGKWGATNPSIEKVADRVTKNGNIEFFQCKSGKTTAMIFYEGTEKNVEIVGDFTEWKPKQLKFFDYASESKKLKLLPIEFSSTARVEYKLIVDGKWINDPLNPNKINNGVGGENSYFSMPDYKPTVWNKGGDVFLDTIDFKSGIYNGARLLQVYVPKDCAEKSCPVLYLQDGSDYVKRSRAVQIQQNIVKAGKIKPFIMVFLDPKDRMKEYWASDDYAKFVAEEVVPAMDKQYNTIKSRDGRAILGASLGGITSFHTAVKYPEIFGRVGGQSSSFWIDDERVVKELEKLDSSKNKFVFYIDDGTLEGVEDSRRVNVMLRGKGFDVTYVEAETGHNWTSWRDRLADAFVALWK
ncbi:MAG: alpha/beta hydrolase-fold protein, partial [Pyrinomonadaceae bacterium]